MASINEGEWDRAIRIVAGIGLGYAAWARWPTTHVWSTGAVTALVLLVMGVLAFVTGLVGWCPAYTAFGFSTRKRIGV